MAAEARARAARVLARPQDRSVDAPQTAGAAFMSPGEDGCGHADRESNRSARRLTLHVDDRDGELMPAGAQADRREAETLQLVLFRPLPGERNRTNRLRALGDPDPADASVGGEGDVRNRVPGPRAHALRTHRRVLDLRLRASRRVPVTAPRCRYMHAGCRGHARGPSYKRDCNHDRRDGFTHLHNPPAMEFTTLVAPARSRTRGTLPSGTDGLRRPSPA